MDLFFDEIFTTLDSIKSTNTVLTVVSMVMFSIIMLLFYPLLKKLNIQKTKILSIFFYFVYHEKIIMIITRIKIQEVEKEVHKLQFF